MKLVAGHTVGPLSLRGCYFGGGQKRMSGIQQCPLRACSSRRWCSPLFLWAETEKDTRHHTNILCSSGGWLAPLRTQKESTLVCPLKIYQGDPNKISSDLYDVSWGTEEFPRSSDASRATHWLRYHTPRRRLRKSTLPLLSRNLHILLEDSDSVHRLFSHSDSSCL